MVRAPIHLMPHRVDVTRPTETGDAIGSPVLTFAAHLSNVRCRIEPQGSSEATLYDRETNRRQFTVWVPGGTDITEDDRLTYGSQTLEVMGLADLQASEVVQRLSCEEIA